MWTSTMLPLGRFSKTAPIKVICLFVIAFMAVFKAFYTRRRPQITELSWSLSDHWFLYKSQFALYVLLVYSFVSSLETKRGDNWAI